MNFKLHIFQFFLLLICVAGCKNSAQPEKPVRAFYFWKTTFNLSADEHKILAANNISKLYIRLFDADWHKQLNKPVPLGTIHFANEDSFLQQLEIVPVIYITNKTLQNIKAEEICLLADSVFHKVNLICENQNIKWRELQLDCDWSETTRGKYFSLLTYMEKHLKEDQFLSATIRLHQIKYKEKTGTPPVKRGMLMFYNLGKTGDEANSIYDYKNAEKYTAYVKKYPLPLDVVLPAFSWTIHKRNGKIINLLNDLSSEDFKGRKHFSQTAYMRFKVEESLFYKGHYFMKNDVLQVEEITPELCKKAAKQISANLTPQSRTIAIFDLDSAQLQQYEKEDFTGIFGAFE